MQAPVTAILGYDLQFFEEMPKLFPNNPKMGDMFRNSPQTSEAAFRNASLQGGYFILAARALGLDCGPMSGFDNAKVDAEFFSDSTGNPPSFHLVKSNFLCNLRLWRRSQAFPPQPAVSL
jgi:3-hydroxypropanoate dehydrogenase